MSNNNLKNLLSTDENVTEYIVCPYCAFRENNLVREISIVLLTLLGPELYFDITAKKLLKKLRKHSTQKSNLPKTEEELIAKLFALNNVLVTILDLYYTTRGKKNKKILSFSRWSDFE